MIHSLDPRAWYVSAVPVGAAIVDADGYAGTVARAYSLGPRMRCLVTVSGDDVPRHRDYGVSEIVRVTNLARESHVIYAGSVAYR